MTQEIHVADVGTIFVITFYEDDVVLDISSALEKSVRFTKPDLTTLDVDLDFVTSGSDGQAYYATVDGDLDQSGTWKLQGIIELPNGLWHSNIARFKVFENL